MNAIQNPLLKYKVNMVIVEELVFSSEELVNMIKDDEVTTFRDKI